MVYEERRRALDYCLDRFKAESAPSLLFFYFSSLDQGCHMLWRYVDEKHPVYDSSQGLDGSIRTLYREMDDSLGRAMEAVDDETTLIAMSDHGFSPFYRGVNLNTWLADAGYISLKDWANRKDYEYFRNVNWNQTKAYALGLNGVYLNLRGREQNGFVSPEEYEARLDVLERDLLAMRDPLNGQRPITLVTRTRRDYRGPYMESGPDLIIGYNEGFRSSWESPLGEFPEEIFVDNNDAWSADHCMNHELIPGILVTNRRIVMENPALHDLTVAVLNEFGVAPTSQMIGKNCLEAVG
jgi:predicted AlkP superfamily phosphohydrolase/phosphomutase